MIAYKLFRLRKDGSLGSLFINRKAIVPMNKWLKAKPHKTEGYAYRPGWHCTSKPYAPHLSMDGRVWCKVEIDGYEEFKRPKVQGSIWFIAKRMRLVEVLKEGRWQIS